MFLERGVRFAISGRLAFQFGGGGSRCLSSYSSSLAGAAEEKGASLGFDDLGW